MNVSVLLLTLNEEENLKRCMSALSWCDDIVVLDSGSIDGTRELAESSGARFFVRPFDNFAYQRNYALDKLIFLHDWILHLDADEVTTPKLIEEIRALDENIDLDAFRIPSKMMFLDKWLRYSGMYPVYQVRLAHIKRMRFIQVGHGQREDLPSDRIGTLHGPYLHYCFSKGLKEWFHKHVDYAQDEANKIFFEKKDILDILRSVSDGSDETARRRGIKDLVNYVPLFLRPIMRFIYMYILRFGFLDGRAGLMYTLLMSYYEYMILVMVRELRDNSQII